MCFNMLTGQFIVVNIWLAQNNLLLSNQNYRGYKQIELPHPHLTVHTTHPFKQKQEFQKQNMPK